MGSKQKRQIARMRQEVSRHKKQMVKAENAAARAKQDAQASARLTDEALAKLFQIRVRPVHERQEYAVEVFFDRMALEMARHPEDLCFHFGRMIAGKMQAAFPQSPLSRSQP